MHPRARRWQLLDYVLVRRRDRQDVLMTKAIRDANVWTDHCLVVSKMRCVGTPRGGSGRASHLHPFPPPVFLTLSRHRTQVEEEDERLRKLQRKATIT
ncbi:unnamed protein product [Schistocephalus solidus]|uniref:Endo/exonuclease/phosphatase domain-containing protein n=1 Tax=Schistocephalus solidus TaxID=70667 RepID=A0A183SZA8_SCHSO|nr:unnamed protein product [Schistocephalus solidus]